MADDDKALTHKQAQEAQELFNAIAPLLIGFDSGVQGNVLAMLLGAWLAGFRMFDKTGENEELALQATRDLRARMLAITTQSAFQHVAIQDEQRLKPKETRQ
jgi:hypothetical protein